MSTNSQGAVILSDKGFCSYTTTYFKKYNVPVIFLKKNTCIGKLLTTISTPITCFIDNKPKELLFFKKVKILIRSRNYEGVKTKRSEIEDLFKLSKCFFRILDFFQHKAYLHARVPGVECSQHVKTVVVPWSRSNTASP